MKPKNIKKPIGEPCLDCYRGGPCKAHPKNIYG
jgi:hypothetical protein